MSVAFSNVVDAYDPDNNFSFNNEDIFIVDQKISFYLLEYLQYVWTNTQVKLLFIAAGVIYLI